MKGDYVFCFLAKHTCIDVHLDDDIIVYLQLLLKLSCFSVTCCAKPRS